MCKNVDVNYSLEVVAFLGRVHVVLIIYMLALNVCSLLTVLTVPRNSVGYGIDTFCCVKYCVIFIALQCCTYLY